MNLYQFTGVRAKTSPATGPETTRADFSAIDVEDAWRKVVELLPCDGEWHCQLAKLWARHHCSLKPRTFLRVTEEQEA